MANQQKKIKQAQKKYKREQKRREKREKKRLGPLDSGIEIIEVRETLKEAQRRLLQRAVDDWD